MKSYQKIISALMAAVMIIALTACSGTRQDTITVSPGQVENEVAKADYGDVSWEPGSWAIYWYLCGSDLESGGGKPGRGGMATLDLEEMLQCTLPDNVTVVIETGGAIKWQNDIISNEALERYVYQGNELRRMETLPSASMGSPDVLADFLQYCNKNYPAEKQAVLLWDHGGGSLIGMELDEQYKDILTLPEFRGVLTAMPAASGIYELVGFDACLMATVDMVNVLEGKARYMVASQEIEPGTGWDYAGFLTALAQNPEMDGAALGREICDSYYAACEKQRGVAGTVTLSVVDLTKAGPLLAAYNTIGQEALLAGCKGREAYFSAFGRAANQSQNYGSKAGGTSPYDMIDLGDLVINAADLLPENGTVLLNALQDCVIYQVKGEYRARASGLACYYHYSADKFLKFFAALGTSEAFTYFYDYTMQGILSAEGEGYVTKLAEAQTVQTNTNELTPASELDLEGWPLVIEETGGWGIDLGFRAHDYLSALYVQRTYTTEDGSKMIELGRHLNYSGDYQKGYFRDGFNGCWYAIDGNLIYVCSRNLQLAPDGNSWYQTFETPVLLNGEKYQIVLGERGDQEYSEELNNNHAENLEFEILYAQRLSDETDGSGTALAEKEMRRLQPGDIIEPLFPTHYYDGNGGHLGPEYAPYGKITVTENTTFDLEMLGDGLFGMNFLMVDYCGKQYLSETGLYYIENEEIFSATVNE